MPGFDLDELGWSPELAENLEPGLVPGRVAAVHRGAFDVWTEAGAVRSRLPGRLVHEGLDVGAGDWVGLSDGLIRAVLPRRSAIVRNAAGLSTTAQTLAANVDVAFAVSSLGPDVEPRRIERYLVTLWESGAAPEIVLTKADRLDDPWPLVAEVEAVALGVPVHVVSAVSGQGCDALARAHRSRSDGRPARLLRRGQVDARQPLDDAGSVAGGADDARRKTPVRLRRPGGRGGDGDPRHTGRRRRGPPHDVAPPAAPSAAAAGS